MNMKQLETFLAIHKFGGFVAAANRLNTTQSNVTARIRGLEQSLGLELFDRSQRRASLTPKGREVLEYAARAVTAFDDIRHNVSDFDGHSGIVRIGVVDMIAVSWLSKLANFIKLNYPKITTEYVVALNPSLIDMMKRDELDIALVAATGDESGFSSRSLGRVKFSWMAGSALPLPIQPVDRNRLAKMPVISHGAESYLHSLINTWFGSRELRPKQIATCNNMRAIAVLTAANIGVSLLPSSLYASELEAGNLQLIRTTPPGPNIDFCVLESGYHTKLLAPFAAHAVEASTFKPF